MVSSEGSQITCIKTISTRISFSSCYSEAPKDCSGSKLFSTGTSHHFDPFPSKTFECYSEAAKVAVDQSKQSTTSHHFDPFPRPQSENLLNTIWNLPWTYPVTPQVLDVLLLTSCLPLLTSCLAKLLTGLLTRYWTCYSSLPVCRYSLPVWPNYSQDYSPGTGRATPHFLSAATHFLSGQTTHRTTHQVSLTIWNLRSKLPRSLP